MDLGECMKVLDIIKLVTKLLNETDDKLCAEYCDTNNLSMSTFLGYLTSEEVESKPEFLTVQADKDLRLILDCINIVQMRICTEFHTLLSEENIVVENGEFEIENLSQKLYKIKQISAQNESVKYSYFENKILLSDGSYKIKYAFIPNDVGFTDSVETHNGNLTLLTIAYGVCSQFCTIKGLSDEAQQWEDKFTQSIAKNFKKLGQIEIKPRRWF